MSVSCFQQILKNSNLVELYYQLIDLNQDLKVIQGVKSGKLKKAMGILTFLFNFFLNQIQNCSVEIKKMKKGIFSFQLKKNYFC